MDGILKALVAIACLVIIAGGGYFAWSEYQDSVFLAEHQTAAKARAQADAERKAQEELAEMQRPCKQALSDLRTYDVFEKPNVQWSAEFLSIQVKECLAKGILTKDDAEKVKHRL